MKLSIQHSKVAWQPRVSVKMQSSILELYVRVWYEYINVQILLENEERMSMRMNPTTWSVLCVEINPYAPTLCPDKETSSKQTTRRSCPMRSMQEECSGMAYMSGSRPLLQRKVVRARANERDIST